MGKQITKGAVLKHLFDNSDTDTITGCWEWQGSKTKDGYGQLSSKIIEDAYGIKGVHRLAKCIVDGWQPQSRYQQTRHACNNRSCWNPDHLETGTAQDNAKDKLAAGTQLNGERHQSAKVSDTDVRTIRAERAAKVPANVLAHRYDISCSQIYRIAAGTSRGDA